MRLRRPGRKVPATRRKTLITAAGAGDPQRRVPFRRPVAPAAGSCPHLEDERPLAMHRPPPRLPGPTDPAAPTSRRP
jgi:hypothetical protein